jgi:hypothetical protein
VFRTEQTPLPLTGHHGILTGNSPLLFERPRRGGGCRCPSAQCPPDPEGDRTRLAHLVFLARVTVVMLLLMRALVSAQDVTEPALKAAFIYNFALFTQWPADLVPEGDPFVLCVVGDADVRSALERIVGKRRLGGRAVAISDLPPGPRRVCHLLYVSGRTSDDAGRLIVGLRDAPVLTISDLDGFIAQGGIAQFFFEQGRLRFSVQLEAARRAHLQISSRLLTLAKQP